ncbi:MAG: hypothetical protein Ct9H300mP19_15220 [Dehalococcoidia bacterium]|nr:MAG: hypothetical protein Ct9H300mP19_15220 [Dehalococcoidia bacterium]
MTHPKHTIVIGGGIVGASVAFHFAKSGVQVDVIESRNQPSKPQRFLTHG